MHDLFDTVLEQDIVSTRRLGVSPSDAFAAFADPNRLARWWGPDGFSNIVETFEFEPGGRWRIIMYAPDGAAYPNDSTFLDIRPGERVVYDHESGHHFIAGLRFAPDGDGTHLTFHMRFDEAAHRNEIASVVIPANEQNFDRLEVELTRGAAS